MSPDIKFKRTLSPLLYTGIQKSLYHYVRVHEEEENDFLIIGGEDHKTGQEEKTRMRDF
ncbi:MAG: hypothetical protein IPM96_21420 [Ignavibacteria bacterium]|nr:hypothetical protein [Ignavibacteria bacterium]